MRNRSASSLLSSYASPLRHHHLIGGVLPVLLLLLTLTAPRALAVSPRALAASLPAARPAKVGMSAVRLRQLDAVVEQAIEQQETPGAVIAVARRGRIVWRKAYGSRSVAPTREAMTVNTIFDVASLTKAVATATSLMILVERGQVRLNDPVARYIPELGDAARKSITIEQLLTHRAGFAPDFDLSEQWTSYDEAIKRLHKEPLRHPPGTRFVYSDIGYIALGEVVRRVGRMSLNEFARRNVFVPLGMRDTGFRPLASGTRSAARIAPTETLRAASSYLGGVGNGGANAQQVGERMLRGEVHDPTAFRMNGVAGHAGLFSTANDLAIYCQMILNGGWYRGVRVLSPMGVAAMMRPRAVSPDGMTRGLGWDITSSYSGNRGDLFPLGSIGHTGFTGTSLWIDPASRTFVVFLSNRLHPDGKGDVTPLRGRIASVVAAAVIDASTARTRGAEANFAAEMLAGIARLPVASASNLANASVSASVSSSVSGTANTSPSSTSSPIPSSTAQTAAPNPSEDRTGNGEVLTGIDVLERQNFKELVGKRIGLVTNHTGRNRQGKPTIDVLREAAGVKLVALFSPEHGIRGELDEENLADSTDEKTKLPIYSLYNKARRPQPEQLKNLDALVFDIQDVGARFYTYISTLGNVMEEAARARIPVYVLDRPNPIGGAEVEGPVADSDKLSFTAYHTIPVRHGMTIGELARFFNEGRRIGCDLRIVKMEGWERRMWFDATGLAWVNPSPNMRSLTQATLYPGIGLLETTNVSVGRGTDTPFEIVGAPWIDGRKLAAHLNNRELAGVRFVPLRFTPKASVLKGEECGGINIIVTDRARFRPVMTGLAIAVALRGLYQAEWKADAYARLLANADTLGRIKQGETVVEIQRSWETALSEYARARARVLLYQ